MTILRGKVMVEDGAFHGEPVDGKYLKRAVPEAVREGPGV